jgi:hypothetical protein
MESKVELIKLVVFVPHEAEERVRLALGEAGAGRIGDYDCCAFVTPGTGYYRPLQGSDPYRGTHGEIETAPELRLEVLCDASTLPAVLEAMRQAHPYEEIAYDLIPLVNHRYAHLVPAGRPDR